jgi:hypothetical protein
MSIYWAPPSKNFLIAVRMLGESTYEHIICQTSNAKLRDMLFRIRAPSTSKAVPHLLNARYRAESHCYSNFLLS